TQVTLPLRRRRRNSHLCPYPTLFRSVPTQASFAFENSLHVAIDHLNVTVPRGNTTIILVNVNNTGNIATTVRTEIRPQNLDRIRSEEHTSELQSRFDIVCRLLLENKN